jgi:hypothetical protein
MPSGPKNDRLLSPTGRVYKRQSPVAAALAKPRRTIAGELDTSQRRAAIKVCSTPIARAALWSWVEQQGETHSGRAMP